MFVRNRPRLAVFAHAAALTLTLALTGCALTGTAPPSPVTGAALQGTIHGGQAPIAGAHIYLYAANTTGYNTTGATNPSVSLLNNVPGSTTADGSGNYYVTSDSGGNFSITSDYTCTPDSGSVAGQQVYLYAIGGSQGGVANAASGLMAVLGDCPAAGTFAGSIPSLVMNEVTTVAAAYAMAGFAWDATHVSSSSTTLAKTGIKNAFANAGNLVNITTGTAYTTTPAGNGTVPQATIYTLANILAACVNSNGAVTGPTSPTTCYTLFNNAESSGSSGTVPSETATAAINIAHNPGANVATLYDSPSTVPPFGSALTKQPNDLTLGITFTGIAQPTQFGIAIDGYGNVWLSKLGSYSYSTSLYTGSGLIELSSLGALLSPSTGYTGGNLNEPEGIAIDTSNNVWVGNYYKGTADLIKFSNIGSVLSGATGYTGGGLNSPWALAIDGSGSVWVSNLGTQGSYETFTNNVVSKFSSAGAAQSGSGGYGNLGSYAHYGIAIDGAGDAWIPTDQSSLIKLSNTGAILSNSGYSGGGLVLSVSIALDSSGNAWSADPYSDLAEISNSGVAISPSSGYTGGGLYNSQQFDTAIDGSGNVWAANVGKVASGGGACSNGLLSEFSNSGKALSGTNGYFTSTYITGTGCPEPEGIAIDPSGNVWTLDYSGYVYENIGAATPVITPIAAGLPSTPTSNGTSNLGTRP